MDDRDLAVLRIERLIGEQRVVYHPSLWYGLLRVVKLLVVVLLLLFVLLLLVTWAPNIGGEKVKTKVICAIYFVNE